MLHQTLSEDERHISITYSTPASTESAPRTVSTVLPFRMTSTLKLIIYAAGVFGFYFYYGIIQEKITRSKYGEEQEPFVYSQSLVFVQCIANAAFAMFVIYLSATVVDHTPNRYYAACAFSYTAAMISSNHALQYVPYPTQALGKSCKPIPVMLLGVLFAQKRYPLSKYLFVFMIVIGVTVFLYKEKKGGHLAGSIQFGFGEILLLFSLLMDGVTGAIQDRQRASYKVKSHHMMLHMNLWSLLYNSIGLLLTGELISFVLFVQKFPFVMMDMILFSFASAFGQYFIFLTVAEFGPLTCSIITTTRKFFTILASVIFFQNPLNSRQWIGTIFVFVGICLDSFYKPSGKTH